MVASAQPSTVSLAPGSLSVAAECAAHAGPTRPPRLLSVFHAVLSPGCPLLATPPLTSHLPPRGQGWPHRPPGAFCPIGPSVASREEEGPLGTQPLVPTCSLVCALVLRSGAAAATQRDLVRPRAAGDMSGKGLHSLGARVLTATCSPRGETEAQVQHRVRGPCQCVLPVWKPQAGAGTGSQPRGRSSAATARASVSGGDSGPAWGGRGSGARGSGLRPFALGSPGSVQASALRGSPALSPVTQSREQGQLRTPCPVRPPPPRVSGHSEASVLPRGTDHPASRRHGSKDTHRQIPPLAGVAGTGRRPH